MPENEKVAFFSSDFLTYGMEAVFKKFFRGLWVHMMTIDQLQDELRECMLVDRSSYAKRLERIAKKARQGRSIADSLARLAQDMKASKAKLLQRCANLPEPVYPMTLPIGEYIHEIKQALIDNRALIVVGETGSGKSTQLPKICLAARRGIGAMIGCTQPRRIAARSIAAKLSEELRSDIGNVVGYKVRFNDRVRPETYIKLMTDGILLAEIQRDPMLYMYDTIIVDEAHERSLNIDFLLGYLKSLLARRDDLRVVITSATIDVKRFSSFFNDAPIIEVSGRSFPVEVLYRPPPNDTDERHDVVLQHAVVSAVDEVSRLRGDGDILVFLSGEREIRESAEALRKHHPPNTEILPLYARLSAREQARIFTPANQRRIVLATNVAETSLTIPRIRYVVDSGYARVSRYSPRSMVQRLPVESVSKASADQRKGRCGRVGPGVCVRLYSEDDYQRREASTAPEILRTHLANVILRMKALGIGDVAAFPFMDKPTPRMLKNGFSTLAELGALDEDGRLTGVGKRLARFPVDVRIARMIVAAEKEACLREVLVIATALSIQDPRERPQEHVTAADEAHKTFSDPRSDFLLFLNMWRFFREQSHKLSKNKLRKLCQRRFLSYRRMLEWQDIHQQTYGIVMEMGLRMNQEDASYNAIHKALLVGLLTNIGRRTDKDVYQGARGKAFVIHPGSSLRNQKPKWLVAAEVVETSRVFARVAARIEPSWLENIAGTQCKRHYCDAVWDEKSGRAMTFENVSLFGLPIVSRRRVGLARVDRGAARRMLIENALVFEEARLSFDFVQQNNRLLNELIQLEQRVRRLGLAIDETQLVEFYGARIPPQICDVAALTRWYQRAGNDERARLLLDRERILVEQACDFDLAAYPDVLEVSGLRLPLEYRFAPGHAQDGATVIVPIVALNLISPDTFEWLIPAWRREKIIALIKSLPKSLRRLFVPVPSIADRCMKVLTEANGSLLVGLADYLSALKKVELRVQDWRLEAVPSHLFVNFRVVDDSGHVLGSGRDLLELQGRLATTARQEFAAVASTSIERQNILCWDFGDLPAEVPLQHGDATLTGYPALKENGKSVDIVVCDDRGVAQTLHRAGIRRLYAREATQRVKYLHKQLRDIQSMCLAYRFVGSCDGLKSDIVDLVIDQALGLQTLEIRSQDDYINHKQQAEPLLVTICNETRATVASILEEYDQVRRQLGRIASSGYREAHEDLTQELSHLIFNGFLLAVPYSRLLHYVRYLQAMRRRLAKLEGDPSRDSSRLAQITRWWDPYWAWVNQQSNGEAVRDDEFRWMLQEFRVSLFAQELGTAYPVSEKRLAKAWHRVVED